MFLGLLLFWLSTIGYLLFFQKKTKVPYELLLPIVFSLNGIIMFLSGILNMMKEFSILMCVGGIILFFCSIIKKEFNIKKMLNVKFLVFLLAFIYITIICSNMHLLHYDNFSHWGLIIKNMFLNNRLPNFEDDVIMFQNYQPGSACFIYYFGLLVGKTEACMIIAQNYLIISYLFSILVFVSSKIKKNENIMYIVFVIMYLFILTANIMFNDLLVDTLIAVMLICSFAILIFFKNDLKKAFIYNLPILIYLFLVKNTGIVLVGFSCLGLVYIGYRNKDLKKGFLYALLSGIISVAFFYIWSKHVTYVFGEMSLYSKHSLSIQNIFTELRNKGLSQIMEFCNIYLKHFLNLFDNLSNKCMLIINVFLIIMIVINRNNRKKLFNCMIVVNVIYLLYYIILGVMYLLSMPWVEAVKLASFDRYMLTIIIVIVALVYIYLFDYMKHRIVVISYLVILLFLSFVVKQSFNNYKMLLGNFNYKDTYANHFDEILGTDMFSSEDDTFYFIYAPISSKGDEGYLYYLSKYKLNTQNVRVVTKVKDIYIDGNIVVFDEDEEIKKFIKDNYLEDKDNVYRIA